MADLATSQGPGHPSMQVTQSPLIGHGSVLFFVRVAGLAFGFERLILFFPPFLHMLHMSLEYT